MPRRVHFCGGRLNNTIKIITAITGLIVAVGGIIAAFGIGNEDAGNYSYTTRVLASPEKYEQFLINHPAG